MTIFIGNDTETTKPLVTELESIKSIMISHPIRIKNQLDEGVYKLKYCIQQDEGVFELKHLIHY